MRVFITGATGFVGAEVVRELTNSGHHVLGLARSDEAATSLADIGADPLPGSLEDLKSLHSGAEASDAVIHLGFNPDFSKFQESCEADRQAIETIGSAIAGSGKPFIVPNGLAGLAPPAHLVTENDAVPENYRFPRVSEQTALGLVSKGVHASVIRLPQVHSTRKQGLVTRLVQVARAENVSAYIGDGHNRWPAAHVSDVAHLFRLVMETGEAGARYHAVAEEGIELHVIAGAIGRILDVPTRSLTLEEAQAHFGPLAMFASVDMPASADETKSRIGWAPAGPLLITDLEQIA